MSVHVSGPPSGRRRRGAAVCGAAALGLLAAGAAGCAAVTAGPTDQTDQHSSYQHTISKVELTVDSGNISLSAGNSGAESISAHLEWNKTKPSVSESWSGSTLVIKSSCPSQSHCSVDFTVQVPAGTEVSSRTTDGDLSVQDLTGGLDATVGTGDVNLAGVGGRIQVGSDTGTVTGTELAAGAVTVHGDTGDVSLGFANAPDTVSAVTSTGNVTVSVPGGSAGYQVTAEAQTGQRTVSVPVDSGSSHTITARTGDGDVTVS
ncbi:DUF4097 family beta strand repeat-containing protein [Actinospica robiniae]|uniref:DUF4097 family beta strand repeat-containing protein n=1 Tax=Actinospica robiniae TaxID=304901 RepID=UPI0012FCA807|nr:DUF4097 family beta strand repeat-containing protein [Actinospica robiniae]